MKPINLHSLRVFAGKSVEIGWGLYVVAVISWRTDRDAITLSAAQMTNSGLSPTTAWRAILIASVVNFLFKFGIVVSLGHAALRWRVAQAFGAALVASGGILLFWPGDVE